MDEMENLNLLDQTIVENIRSILDYTFFSALNSSGRNPDRDFPQMIESLERYRTSNLREYEKAIMSMGGSRILTQACCIKKPWIYDELSPTWNLIKQANLHIIQAIIRTGTHINDENHIFLHLAAASVHTDIVKELIRAGADVNAQDEEGYTPLHYLAEYEVGSLEIAAELIKAGADVTIQDKDGCTPLHRAGYSYKSSLVRELIKLCIDVNVRDKYWQVAPLHSVAISGDTKSVKLLMQVRASLRIQDKSRRTPLHCAAYRCDRETIEALINAGSDVYQKNDEGLAPIEYSPVREILLNKQLDKIYTMLSMAPVVEISFENLTKRVPVEINPIDMALYAIQHENINLFKLAVSQMLDVNKIINTGDTLLHIAVREGKANFVEILLKKGGINLKHRNGAGEKVGDLAVKYPEIAEQIETYKARSLLQRVGFFSRVKDLESRLSELEQRLEMQIQKNSMN